MVGILQRLQWGVFNLCTKSRLPLICLLITTCINPTFAKVHRIESGQLEGILTQKSTNWIDVRDDQGYVNRYLPHWVGESPSRGGGFDPVMLQTIEDLVVGNRVFLKWNWDRHLRIVAVNIIVPPEMKGSFEGYLLGVGDKWVDVQNYREGKPWRFYLPWLGGYPANGGGYDREMLNFFHNHNPREPVYFDWVYDLRPRITRILKFEEAKFVPFFAGKEVAAEALLRSGDKKEQAAPANPFEQAASANPFEQAAPANPFENVPLPK